MHHLDHSEPNIEGRPHAPVPWEGIKVTIYICTKLCSHSPSRWPQSQTARHTLSEKTTELNTGSPRYQHFHQILPRYHKSSRIKLVFIVTSVEYILPLSIVSKYKWSANISLRCKANMQAFIYTIKKVISLSLFQCQVSQYGMFVERVKL